MRIAILTNNADSYPKPMALGLQRMLKRCDVESDVIHDGWDRIRRTSEGSAGGLRDLLTFKPVRTAVDEHRKIAFFRRLKSYDAVIVVGHMPMAYMRGFLDDELLRRHLEGTPLLLYDLVYLPTRGGWLEALQNGSPDLGIPDGGHYGIERYDRHLCVSVVSEFPFPAEPQPCNVIGIDLDDGSLHPEQRSFRALIDFERPGYERQREVQIEGLERAGIPYTQLKGSYGIQEIRAEYRRAAVFFIAFRESFGLPICEVQACGGMIATPREDWVPAHWLKEDLSVPGPGKLGSNFLVYGDSASGLEERLLEIKSRWSPEENRQRFLEEYPGYYHGDVGQLADALHQVGLKL